MYQRTVPFGESIKRAWSNYCIFTGRASRSEFWFWQLFLFIIYAIISIIGGAADSQAFIRICSAIVGVVVFLPSLGLLFRRLHDTGRSGWWILINLIPIVGSIVLLIFELLPSQPTANKYGNVPNIYS